MPRPERRFPPSSDDGGRMAAIVAALDDVLDPELDAPVTEMGFIESVVVEGEAVEILFRLPTFWCSANFAFLMAADMKVAVEALPWVRVATVRLLDHFAAAKINRGIATGQTFSAVFVGEARTDLAEIRRTFREKAFLGRQERLLRLLAERRGVAHALELSMGGLRALAVDEDVEIRGLALRYLGARLQEGGATADEAPAFTTLEGGSVRPDEYVAHLRALRRVRGAAEANAEMCRIYLEARATHPVPGRGSRGCGGEREDG